jgi:hypothetical protein
MGVFQQRDKGKGYLKKNPNIYTINIWMVCSLEIL